MVWYISEWLHFPEQKSLLVLQRRKVGLERSYWARKQEMVSGLKSISSRKMDTSDYYGEREIMEGSWGEISQREQSLSSVVSVHHKHLGGFFQKLLLTQYSDLNPLTNLRIPAILSHCHMCQCTTSSVALDIK